MPRSDAEIFADIEQDRALREGEIKLLQSIIGQRKDEKEQRSIRRSLILVVYSHFEGFCKFVLGAYAEAINARAVTCDSAKPILVSTSLARPFVELIDKNTTLRVLKDNRVPDPDVDDLHRRKVFLEELDGLFETIVRIPDSAIDTQSNLKPIVLKRLLFRLDLDFSFVDAISGDINKLLGVRNAIAHGDVLKAPNQTDLDQYIAMSFDVMSELQNAVLSALNNKAYLKATG